MYMNVLINIRRNYLLLSVLEFHLPELIAGQTVYTIEVYIIRIHVIGTYKFSALVFVDRIIRAHVQIRKFNR